MLSIIYAYRNREHQRIRLSLESLEKQSNKDFQVFFVDYGSAENNSQRVKEICKKYHFVNYSYCSTEYQPWNKSKALNFIIKKVETEYCFIADVDIIFHSDFVNKAVKAQNLKKAIYFQVGFLKEEDTIKNEISKDFNEYSNYRKSNREVTGMTLIPVKALREVRGYDEFFHCWGAEDTDMHVRLINAGYEVVFFDNEVLLLHQAHMSYRSTEQTKLTNELQISGIVQLNHEHLNFAREQKITRVNVTNWGECMNHSELNELLEAPVTFVVSNEQRKIDDLLLGQLPQINNKIIKVRILEDPRMDSIKFKLKGILGKKIPQYYSLKEINDKILLHLISFYRGNPYIFRVKDNMNEIEFSVKL